MKVLITTSSFGEGAIRVLEKSGFEVINNSYKRKITQAELVPLLEGVQGILFENSLSHLERVLIHTG